MIISASRRTDIPAFYADWFVNRLREGYVLVPNPYNRKQIKHVTLSPERVDCIVFWTKNPEKLMPYLDEIEGMGYSFYFEYTLTGYGRDVEGHLPDKGKLVENFTILSEKIGKERVDWRYDPVFLDKVYDMERHMRMFEELCKSLSGHLSRCIISFIDLYGPKTAGFEGLTKAQIYAAAEGFSRIGGEYGIPLYACAEKEDLKALGINRSSCIDPDKVENITGKKLFVDKDKNQRAECGCAESVDIGMYDTCLHGCRYCYATGSVKKAGARAGSHLPSSPLQCGRLMGDEIIKYI